MKKRIVKVPKKCGCGNVTYIQVFDFLHSNWVYYCETCQETIDDPNSI